MSSRASAYAKELIVCPNGERISRGEKLVLICLADNHQDKAKHFTYPSIETIAEDALCDRRSCQRHLDALERKGVIKRLRPAAYGRTLTTFYFFTALDVIPEGWQNAALFTSMQKGGKRAAKGRQKGDKTCNASITNINQNEELEPVTPPNPQLSLGEQSSEADTSPAGLTPEQLDHLARCRERGEDPATWERHYREENARAGELIAAAVKVRTEFPDCERAALEVMKQCGFVLGPRPERNPVPGVLRQVLGSQESVGAPPWVTGPRMIAAWRNCKGQRGVDWGPLKFFRDAHWLGYVGREAGTR